ncbi:MAG: DUF1080 domain-containing protein [Planctomycetaceae bacterium]|nr:DUF1080 domain-containing protein [Planctomycetaceae bacterium]
MRNQIPRFSAKATTLTRNRHKDHSRQDGRGWTAETLPKVSRLLCVLAWALLLPGCGGGDEKPATDNASGDVAADGDGKTNGNTNKPTGIDPASIPIPDVKTGVCRVYTPKPGFFLLIDGELVRDEESEDWLKTPCAVTLPVGNHDVKVAKAGFRDTPLPGRVSVTADAEAEAILQPVEDPLGITDSVLDAPYLNAKVGEPIALESLNSARLETDPFITADGLAIYFAANRSEGNGIYAATRPSPYVEFYPPELLQNSRGRDDKATPSVTDDARLIAYAMPEKQRVVALTRETPLGDFIDKQNLKYSSRAAEFWRSALMLGDGLRFYWTIEIDGQLETRVTSRNSLDDRFGEMRRVDMPGVHPCLSSDGLRQYVFDGETVSRARREKVTGTFSRLETIATVSLENYVHSSKRRQYFVSDDEQWLFYCSNPDKQGDLYMVRLSQGASWGFAAFGTNIPNRTVVANNPTIDEPDPKTPTETDPKVDPQTLPLPYTTHWKQFNTLMATKKYDAAKKLVEQSLADAKFARDRELLEWDRTEVERVIGFWNDVRQSLETMKPGDPLRFGAAKVTLIKFEDDLITAKARTKEVSKVIYDMTRVDVLAIADLIVEKIDEAGQARMATFLYYDPKGGAGSAKTRFDRAGAVGPAFYERQAVRVLHQAQQEFDRDKIAEGLAFVAKVSAEHPASKAAEGAKELESKAYEFTKWQQSGRWKTGGTGEFIAGSGRVANSYLMSPKTYENFELRLEWKTTANGSGGVFFRYRGRGDANLYGYKIQLTDDFGSGRTDPQTTGALFNTASPTRNAVRKRGEWNTLRMQVRGTQVTVEINGTKVLDNAAEVTDFKAISGYVVLDGVPGGITYRKTLLMELPVE